MSFIRFVDAYAFNPDWMRTKMVFLFGPRQAGKTFLAKRYLKGHSKLSLYYNWDTGDVRRKYLEDPNFFVMAARASGLSRPTLVFDEFHKRNRWKNELKGIYDEHIDSFNLVVTGSARLDLLRQTGESLAGRYFSFRVLPLGIREVEGKAHESSPPEDFSGLIDRLLGSPKAASAQESLLSFSGFPEPLSKGSTSFRRKWVADYTRLVLKEDLKDLSKIQEIDRVEVLWMRLLPERVGSPLSVNSLKEDLSASHEAIQTWLLNLEKLYCTFSLMPYSKKMVRAVKKEKKTYLMDWALIQDESKRFENYVIASLMRSLAIWNDAGLGDFELRYIRNTLGNEADFLILRDKKPWILGDVKLKDSSIDSHLYRMAGVLGDIPILQVVKESGTLKMIHKKAYLVSADRLFGIFP